MENYKIETTQPTYYRHLLLLVMTYLTLVLTASVMAYKLVNIGIALFPGSEFIYPLVYTLGDIITEVYGYRVMRKVIWFTMICSLLFSLISIAILHLPSPPTWNQQAAYQIVFNKLPRITISDFIATLAALFSNAYILSKWKILLRGRYFWLRSVGSSAIGIAIYLLIAIIFAFYHVASFPNIWRMIFSTYIFKLMYLCITAAPATLLVYYLKISEKISAYDTNINFNPFRIDL